MKPVFSMEALKTMEQAGETWGSYNYHVKQAAVIKGRIVEAQKVVDHHMIEVREHIDKAERLQQSLQELKYKLLTELNPEQQALDIEEAISAPMACEIARVE